MKHFLFSIILLSGFQVFAKQTPPRLLDNETARVTLIMQERAEAEAEGQPNEIVMTVQCKKGFKQKKRTESIPLCTSDLQAAKGIEMDSSTIKFFHYMWDSKASNNLEGRLYCNTKDKVNDEFKLSDFCEKK